MTHKTKDCVERPRKVGARWSNKHIAADEKVGSLPNRVHSNAARL